VRIITAATVLVTPGAETDSSEMLFQPERDIPAEATTVHGISTETAREHGVDREIGIALLVGQLSSWLAEDRPLVGHNVTYDLTVLDREMKRLGLGSINMVDGVPHLRTPGSDWPFYVIDTYVLDKAVDRYRPGKRQLSFVAAHYGVPMAEGTAHGATADVIASLRVAIAIANLYADSSIGSMTLPELHMAQIGWAAQQARGLREYFLKKNNKEAADSVSEAWPIRPREDQG
jgi:DNA polymerase-3 subunit epsilon